MDGSEESGYNPLEAKYGRYAANDIRKKFELSRRRGNKRPDHHRTPSSDYGGSGRDYEKGLPAKNNALEKETHEEINETLSDPTSTLPEKPFIVIPPIPEKTSGTANKVPWFTPEATPDPNHQDLAKERKLKSFGRNR